jgi:type I restriction enzyme R subunit
MGAEPERKSLVEIDRRLDQTGWQFQDYDEMDMSAAHGLAMSEFPPGKNGGADYLLYTGGKVIGVLEAKPEGRTLCGIEVLSSK